MLQGIDCPELGQAWASRAKQMTSSMAFGKAVRVTPCTKDLYGRMVANVYLPGGTCLDQDRACAGWAWWYETYAPHDQVPAQLQVQAKAAKRGPWADARPVPPWKRRARARRPRN